MRCNARYEWHFAHHLRIDLLLIVLKFSGGFHFDVLTIVKFDGLSMTRDINRSYVFDC